VIDTYGITDVETKLKYLRLIQKMDQVEINFHRANMTKETKK
jgi:hypothetical protein